MFLENETKPVFLRTDFVTVNLNKFNMNGQMTQLKTVNEAD